MAKAFFLVTAAVVLVKTTLTTTSANKKARPIIVSCVGDSITQYGCASSPDMTYVAQLQRILGQDKYTVTNYGVSGMTMLKHGSCTVNATYCTGNCSYWDTKKAQEAFQSNPDIVTIMLGTNDAKSCNWYGPPNGGDPFGELGVPYRSAYLDMIATFHSLPSRPKVFVVIPPPLTNPPQHPDRPPPFGMKKHVLNELLPQTILPSIVAETGAEGLIDTWTALGGDVAYQDPDMTCDGCHPKDKAMTIIAQTIAQAIVTASSSSSSSSDKEEEEEQLMESSTS